MTCWRCGWFGNVVTTANTIINNNKYLLFITPKNIIDYLVLINKNRSYIEEFYQIVYLAINTPKKFFNVGSTFAYFLIQNKKYTDKTQIEYLDINGKINFISYKIKPKIQIPNNPSKIVMELLDKLIIDDSKLQWNYSDPLYKGKIKTNLPSHFHSTVNSHGDASWANNTGTIEKLIIENIEISWKFITWLKA